MAKSISELVIEAFPELEGKILFHEGIWLQNDSDGTGDYIAKWEYSEPIPESLESYKR
jgi:hypothetical protein